MTGRYALHGPTLVNHGWDITPVQGKRPILEGWSNRPEAAVRFHDYNGASIGVLCGGRYNIVAIDVDVMNPFAANEIQQLIEDDLGFGPRRIGKAPKFLMLFRCSEQVRKIKTGTYWIDDADAAVEVLAEGQQFVASGIHPDTQSKYVWPDDNILDLGPLDLQEVTPEQLEQFREKAARVLDTYGDLKGRVSTRSALPRGGLNLSDLSGERATVSAALDVLPNADEHYDDWIATLHAIKGALGEEGRELAHEWSKRSAKYEAQETDRAWDSIKNVNHIGAGSLYHWAREHGFDLRSAREPQHVRPVDITIETEETGHILRASEVRGPLPKRDWLLDQWFPAKAVSALFGQGGVGKTLLAQQLANCVATGRQFLGIETRRMPVLAVFCEDDRLEISRRQLDINDWMGVNEITESGPDDFYIWPRVGMDNILVTFPSQGKDVAGEFYGQLCEQVEAVKEDSGSDEVLLIVDTAADVFGGNEIVRREVNTFIKTYLGSFCVNYDASVLLLAHPSVAGMNSGTGLSGSSAWENAVRARAYLTRDDADDDLRILSRKKSNYSAIGNQTDIRLLWDKGAFGLPTTPTQVDRIEQRGLKNKIIEAVEGAYREQNPFKKRSGRKLTDALPTILAVPRKDVIRAVADLELSGEIVLEPRKGYRAGKSL